MRHALRRACLLAATAWLLGCGEGPDDPTRYNRPLGEAGALTPVGAGPIDMAILKDPADYTPAPFEPLGPTGPTAPEDSREAAAIRRLLDDFYTAMLDRDIDAMLDAIEPDKVAALREGDFADAAYELTDALERLWSVLKDKSAGTDLGPLLKAIELLPSLKDTVIASLTIEVESDDSVHFDLDVERLQANLGKIREPLVEAMDAVLGALPEGMLGADAPKSGQQAYDQFTESLPDLLDMLKAQIAMQPEAGGPVVRKVGDEWKVAAQSTVTEEQAEALSELLRAVKDAVDALTGQLQNLESISTQQLIQIVPAWSLQAGLQVMPAAQRLQQLFAPGTEAAGGEAEGESTETEAGEVSFSRDVLPIFESRCERCHQPGGRALRGGVTLDLRADQAYAQLVNQPSATDEERILVVPSDVQKSYLYEKISSDSPAEGERMPAEGEPLTEKELATIRAWIEAGAPDN